MCGLQRGLVCAIRGHWPRVEIPPRADRHCCAPEVLEFCRAERVDYIRGVATTMTLRRHVETLERNTAARQAGTAGPKTLRPTRPFTATPGIASSTSPPAVFADEVPPCGRNLAKTVADFSG